MAITDELREYARAFDHVWFKSDGTAIFTTGIPPIDAVRLDEHVLAIADHIDAEHAEAQRRWMAELDAARDRDGWVELPKDADGEYIRIGDVMAYADNTKPMEVVALVPPAVFLTEDGPRFADMCRHYHTPTVEDVLREFVDEFNRDDTELCDGEIIERFAAKLRLAGEGDE